MRKKIMWKFTKSYFRKHRIILSILGAFFLVNIVFNFNDWALLFGTLPKSYAVIGESTMLEFGLEQSYRNIMHLENPFVYNQKLFYPYSINLALNDPGMSNMLFFIPLRTFMSPRHILLLIVLLNTFFSNVCMYALLRKLKISKMMAFVFGLSFGFMPIAAYRLLGHYNYVAVYVYPLWLYLFICFSQTQERFKKILFSLAIGGFSVFILLLNFYYFITILISIIFYFTYHLFFQLAKLGKYIRDNYLYGFAAFLFFSILLIPWFLAVFRSVSFDGVVHMPGFVGAIELSGDLFGFVAPNELNPFYRSIIVRLPALSHYFNPYVQLYLDNRNKFIYPGIFILVSYAFLFLFYKRLPKKIWLKLKPHFFISLIFAVFLLGPFLKVLGHWTVPLDDGIRAPIMLPFLILHYIPGLSSLRAPTRFVSVFIFLALIVVSYMVDYVRSRSSLGRRKLLLAILLIIFFVDQYYVLPQTKITYFPSRAYNLIKKDRSSATVLEIPFTVRDGFRYIGFVHAINPIHGALIHGKPVIGGYFARVHPAIFDYYDSLSFVGYLADITDKGNYDPIREKPLPLHIYSFTGSLEAAQDELNFLNIKYVVLKSNEKYSLVIANLLKTVGFEKVMNDDIYGLYTRQVKAQDFTRIDFGSEDDNLFVAQGYSFRENGFRWTEGKLAKIFVKTNRRSLRNIIFEAASFHESQDVRIYLNDEYLATQKIGVNRKQYRIGTDNKLTSGVNVITFKFSKSFRPKDVLSKGGDMRELAVQWYWLEIK